MRFIEFKGQALKELGGKNKKLSQKTYLINKFTVKLQHEGKDEKGSHNHLNEPYNFKD